MAMLFDLEALDDATANHSLECMCKSLAEPAAGDEGIWALHDSPYLQALVEGFTQQGLATSQGMAAMLKNWFSGGWHFPVPTQFPGFGPVWPVAELPGVAAYLASKTPATMLFGDWGMLVDYLLQTHFSATFAATNGEWLAVRSVLMGKLQASVPAATLAQAGNALAAMPNTAPQVLAAFGFTRLQKDVLHYATARCTEQIVSLSDQTRHRMKSLILADIADRMGSPAGAGPSLQSKLFDSFAELNRDWRRIAITEAGEAANQGFVSNMAIGARIRRMEHYRGACGFCRSIDRKVFEVVAPDAPEKDGKTQVWVGKTNLGRSASPRKKYMGSLMYREEGELWWAAAGLQHPHCRGLWVLQDDSLSSVNDPRWAGWLASLGL